MDCLEKRLNLLHEELEAFKSRAALLENQNVSLRSQLAQVQTQVATSSSKCNCIKAVRSRQIRFHSTQGVLTRKSFTSCVCTF